ncbi:class I SAM-dependent methyltransferase [Segetibacter sp. 3557_3]|uniref:class I SAM-dependent methyltransferase n=1 Tax=Segetibacter sp. 3557_3 TaxID=2547429 RepID=UPI00105917A9|nr:class I SAM-dependent methyltransferase [Segetibacter sp. 3557_3]TDH20632.1 class I SAM-dependent methyltransferase [Segetibacter sp. 3557_3]
MKDLFSKQANEYSAFRPSYPQALFEYLVTLVPSLQSAWDCGTGNGQVAGVLAGYFHQVYATDISPRQLAKAVQRENLFYSEQPAEQTNFRQAQFDLITVAQAIHWFNFQCFYNEVRRTLKAGGILAVIGYGLLKSATNLDDIISEFYSAKVGRYWDEERRYIDEEYRSIPFPFVELQTPHFQMEVEWSIEQLIGYFNTWSAVQHYMEAMGNNPVDEISDKIREAWGPADKRKFIFPILLRIARAGE